MTNATTIVRLSKAGYIQQIFQYLCLVEPYIAAKIEQAINFDYFPFME